MADDDSVASSPLREPAPQPQAVANGPMTFSLLAHLARRGDVAVSPGQWAGGPETPTPIEGVEVRSEARSDARLELQALISGQPPRWTDWAAPGNFVGSRGLGRPLIGVRLRIVGSDAERFEIGADALFLGAPVLSKRGRALELVSGASADALVGLRLNVWEDNQQSERRAIESRRRSHEPRLRIFRASATAEN
jgi:hypothetical protein